MPPTTSLDDLNLDNEPEKKITPHDYPTGAEESVVPGNYFDGEGDVSGEITTRDKKWTRLNIGQKAGNIGEAKGFGSLVANRDFVLLPGFPSTQSQGPWLQGVTVVKFQKAYQEKRPYDPSATTMPRIFRTAKEANEAGFSIEYGVTERFVQPVGALLFLIPAPVWMKEDEGQDLFTYVFNDVRYMAAGFFATGSSWHECVKPILTAIDTPKALSFGDDKLRAGRWNLAVIRRTGTKGAWYALKSARSEWNSKEFLTFTREILP